MECAEIYIPERGIFFFYALKGSIVRPPLTTGRHFRKLCKYVKISFP